MSHSPSAIEEQAGKNYAVVAWCFDFYSKAAELVTALVGSAMAAMLIGGAGSLAMAAALLAPAWQAAAASLFLVWCVFFEVWFLRTTWHVFWYQYFPGTVEVALRQPRLPAPLRPIAALWWGYQCVMALACGIGFSISEPQMSIAEAACVAIVTSALGYLTFGYLLLAVSAFTKGPVISRLCSWRRRWMGGHLILVIAARFAAEFL